VLSFLVIDDTDGITIEEMLDDTSSPADPQHPNVLPADQEASVAAAAAAYGPSSDQQLWSEIVSKRHRYYRVDTFKQSAVTALYVDQSLKRNRENRLTVTGLAPVPTCTDTYESRLSPRYTVR
jgi:hypothetical protein